MGRIGTQELLIIAGIALLIFGPSRLPLLGKTIGKTIGAFKNSERKAAAGEDAITEESVKSDVKG
jgi:sec-independent protein translocase protein TatA